MASPRSLLSLLALAVFCALPAAYAQDDADKPPLNLDGMGDLFGNQNKVCETYSCPKPYVPVNKWPLGITSTGCQASGMGMQMTMGGTNQYKHIEHCCHLKNACYQLCGSKKATCDAEMEKCMEKSCEELTDTSVEEFDAMSEDEIKKEKDECTKMKSIVKLLGDMGGCNEYDSHQRRTCECVDKEKLAGKMERVLRNYYKKFNPEGIEKVKGLMEKTDGKRAIFNKILYGLVKKYPAAIKKKVVEMPDPLKMDL